MKPLTREFLLSRGHCCHHRCRNCPYQQSNAEAAITRVSQPLTPGTAEDIAAAESCLARDRRPANEIIARKWRVIND